MDRQQLAPSGAARPQADQAERRDDPELQFEVESTLELDAEDWTADMIEANQVTSSDPKDPRFEFIQMETDTISIDDPKLFARLRVWR